MYIRKSFMPNSYEISMSFGTFNIGLAQCESEHERHADDSATFSYCGQPITRGQYRELLAERDRRADIDAVHVVAANVQRETALAGHERRTAAARTARQATQKRTLEGRITWVDGELTRAKLKYESECERLGAIKVKAELELLGV